MLEKKAIVTTPTVFPGSRAIATGVLGTIVFATLTFVGANIVIPLQPVPVTLQTLFVLLAGSILGRGRGGLSQSLYIVSGFALPVYAGGAVGLAVIAGPTGGFLMSFAVAPLVVGWMIRRSDSLAWHVASFVTGTLVIFAMGVTHLAVFYTDGLASALRVGLLPFIPGAVLKVIAAVSIHRSYTALARRRRG